MAADGREIDDVAGFPRPHARQDRGDAVEHAPDVHIDHPIPLVDLEFVQGRERHETRVVEDDVDRAVGFDQAFDACGH
jgi:hypothetical protein